MDGQKPLLNWVRDDNREVILTGGAVRVGKLGRLQAEWPSWGYYTRPERFTIRPARTRFGAGSRPIEIPTDVDGPPRAHSLSAWQAGVRNPRHQRRYIFTDMHKNKSGELTVSSLDHYTTTPSIEASLSATVPIPYAPAGQVAVRGGNASTRYHIGAVADPRVRVSLLVTSGDGGPSDLTLYLPRPRHTLSPSRDNDLMFIPHDVRRPGWLPALANGSPTLEVDVDEQNFAQITVIPQGDYRETSDDFMAGFAIRAERADDPAQFVISDIVTVQGGGLSRRFRNVAYPEGGVLFRA